MKQNNWVTECIRKIACITNIELAFNIQFKGTIHPEIILLKYLMLITVNKNITIIITNYIWYYRSKVCSGPPLRLHRMSDSKVGRRKVKCSDVTWARSTLGLHRYLLVSGSPRAFFDDSAFFETIGIIFILWCFFCLKLIWLNISHDVNLARLLRYYSGVTLG